MNNSIDVSFVIPVYNDEQRIKTCLKKTINYLEDASLTPEIVIVCDGCDDSTPERADARLRDTFIESTVIRYDDNRGKGRAVKEGMLEAKGKYRLFMDVDLSTPLHTLEDYKPHFQDGAPIVIGSRYRADSNIVNSQPWYRRIFGRGFTYLANQALGLTVNDYTCGFKAFRHDVARNIFSRTRIEGYAFDAEVMFLADQLNLSVREVPVDWRHHRGTTVSVPRAIVNATRDLLAIRKHYATGGYDIV
jgi:dolichyl-phosphate beta-glucosyltransferase